MRGQSLHCNEGERFTFLMVKVEANGTKAGQINSDAPILSGMGFSGTSLSHSGAFSTF